MPTRAQWFEVWRQIDAIPADGLFEELMARYAEPQRHYHNQQHLDECLTLLEQSKDRAQRPEEVELALWFHDAVYDPRAKDNEDCSAAWAEAALRVAGADPAAAGRVRRLILATKHVEIPDDPDAQLIVDIDLAILGAGEARFDEYERHIRAEYDWVDAETFVRERTRILNRFLERASIYSTAWFRGRLEAQARSNLRRALATLGA